MPVREWRLEDSEPIKPSAPIPVQPPVQLQQAPQEAPGREIVQDARIEPSPVKLEPKMIIDKEGRHEPPTKDKPNGLALHRILEVILHSLALMVYFVSGIVVGYMACVVVGSQIG